MTKEEKNMEDLLRSLKDLSNLRIKIGIFGSKNIREGQGSNAEIGAKHEFGEGVPPRSFLRMPLNDYFPKFLEKSGALTKKTIEETIKEKSFLGFMKKVALIAESTVLGAFESGGFGQWKPSNMEFKKVKQTLVETGQLRNSIVSEVE